MRLHSRSLVLVARGNLRCGSPDGTPVLPPSFPHRLDDRVELAEEKIRLEPVRGRMIGVAVGPSGLRVSWLRFTVRCFQRLVAKSVEHWLRSHRVPTRLPSSPRLAIDSIQSHRVSLLQSHRLDICTSRWRTTRRTRTTRARLSVASDLAASLTLQGHDEKVASPVLDRESGGKAALYASEGHAHEGFNLAPVRLSLSSSALTPPDRCRCREGPRVEARPDGFAAADADLPVGRRPRAGLTAQLQLHRPLQHRQRPCGRPRTRLWHHARPVQQFAEYVRDLHASLTGAAIYYAVSSAPWTAADPRRSTVLPTCRPTCCSSGRRSARAARTGSFRS